MCNLVYRYICSQSYVGHIEFVTYHTQVTTPSYFYSTTRFEWETVAKGQFIHSLPVNATVYGIDFHLGRM